jgi:two-component system sensor histidine kinase/response regulator
MDVPISRLQDQVERISTKLQDFMEASSRNRDLLRLIFEESLDGLMLVELDKNTIVAANPALHQMLGFENGKLLTTELETIYNPRWEDVASASAELDSSDLSQGPVLLNQVFTKANGESHLFDITTNMVEWNGNPAGLFTLRDAELRRKSDAEKTRLRRDALEAVRMKSAFLANMSHEIRTPLNGVLGMVEILQNTTLSESQQEFVSTIRHCGETLLALINDILDFSKLEASKMTFDSSPFDLQVLLEETLDIVVARAHDKNLDLVLEFSPEVSRHLKGDRMRLQQIIMNLLSNAVKFTERGSVVLQVNMFFRSGGIPEFRFLVRDTGIGMSQEVRDTLFMPFCQGDSSVTRQYGGTGLGLAISKRLVDGMGGSIDVSSHPGSGTTFEMRIPLEVIPDISLQETRIRKKTLRDQPEVVIHCPSMQETQRVLVQLVSQSMGRYRVVESAMDMQNVLGEHAAPFSLLVECAFAEQHAEMLGRWINKSPHHRLIVLLRQREQMLFSSMARSRWQSLRLPVRKELLLARLLEAQGTASATTQPTTKSEPAMSGTGHRLLLVEDDAINRRVATLMLQRVGYTVDYAEDGKKSLEMLSERRYSAVLMDCQMPVMDGFTATRLLRDREQDSTKHQLVIALTANAMEGDRERCLAAGFDDYIRKPVQSKELYDTLEAHLNASEDSEYQTLSRKSRNQKSESPSEEFCAEEPLYTSKPLKELQELVGDTDASLIGDMVEAICRELPEVLAKMSTALSNSDTAIAARFAHQFESRTGNVGLRRHQALLNLFQTDWKKQKTDRLERILQELHHHLHEALRQLRADW